MSYGSYRGVLTPRQQGSVRRSKEKASIQPACTISTFEWIAVIASLLVLQSAFIVLPIVIASQSESLDIRGLNDPVYSGSIIISTIAIGLVALPYRKKVFTLLLQNQFSLLFAIITVCSIVWSIHPDITLRRAAGYQLTVLLAAYLAARFGPELSMKALSYSFAISAIASILFVIAYPQFGIMHGIDYPNPAIEGTWRGVFPHKNVIGPTMSAAIFAELYLLLFRGRLQLWRFGLLGLYFLLIIFSRSNTGLFVALTYLVGTVIYFFWRHSKLAGGVLSFAVILFSIFLLIIISTDPDSFLSVIGRDATLTGRTQLWDVVLQYIKERPLLGFGYRAMWIMTDTSTIVADEKTGGWGITGSQNGFLEVALELGLLGFAVLFCIIIQAFWRAVKCCALGIGPLGWFAMMFFIGDLMSNMTEETMGQNQNIHWLIFNVVVFCCGLQLKSLQRSSRRAQHSDRLHWQPLAQ